MDYPPSIPVTRLIKRLTDAIEPKALTLGQLKGLSNAIETVQKTDSNILRNVNGLELFQQQLTQTQKRKRYAQLGATPGQLDIEGNELTA